MQAGRLKQYLRDLDVKRAPARAPGYSIAVSRECFAFGSTTCQELSRQLGWPIYGYDLLEMVAREMHVSKAEIDAMDEEGQQWMKDMFRALERRPDHNAFVVHWKEVIERLGRSGQAIFLGRGATAVLAAATCLRVRIVASLERRIQRCMQRLGLDRRRAMRRVKQTDSQRADFVRQFFHVDLTDPHEYDLVVNSDECTAEQCASVILTCAKVRWPDFHTWQPPIAPVPRRAARAESAI